MESPVKWTSGSVETIKVWNGLLLATPLTQITRFSVSVSSVGKIAGNPPTTSLRNPVEEEVSFGEGPIEFLPNLVLGVFGESVALQLRFQVAAPLDFLVVGIDKVINIMRRFVFHAAPSAHLTVIGVYHMLDVLRELVSIEVARPCITVRFHAVAKLVEDNACRLVFRLFRLFVPYREERQKFGVEAFGEPRVPCIGFEGLPRDIADVLSLREELEFLVFVPSIVGAVVIDARRFRAVPRRASRTN